MYPSESGTRDRVPGPAHLAAASFGIGVPIVTAGILVVALFSPGLWTSVPLVTLVMLAVFVANAANLIAFLALHRARAGPGPFRSALGIGAVFSGICISAVLVLAAFFARLGA